MRLKSVILASTSFLILAGAAPAFAQTDDATTAAQDAAVASADAGAQEEDAIVVTGLRRSLETSQKIKRESEGIVDAIVAEDIGKLPDTFASSALQRVPGVNVTRGGGEAAGVTVRGLPDLTTTYNGREIFTAEGRFVAIQDFPAGTVAALEVYKSGLANQVEGGIAGAVNVRGRKPFDFSGFELSGSLNYVHSEQAQREAPNGNLLISDRWDTGIGEMGLLLNASYIGIEFLDSTREQSMVIGRTNQAFTDRGRDQISNYAPGAAVGLRFPDAQGNFLGYGKRWRPSANAAFQWKPTPELEIYADGLFQGFRSQDYNRWMFIPIFGPAFNNPDNAPPLTLSNITTFPGTDQISSMTVTNAANPDGWTGSFNGKTDTYQAGGGLIWTRDRLRVSADVAYTDSQFTANNVNVDYSMVGTSIRNVQFEAGQDGGPTQTFVNYDITDPTNFTTRGLWQELTVVNGKDWQARTDLSYDLDMGFLKRLDVGVRYANRKAGRDYGNFYANGQGIGVPLMSLPGAEVRTSLPGFTFNRVQPNVFYAAITRDSIRDNLTELRSFFGAPAGTPAFFPTDNFRANEKSYAAYAQLKYGFDLGGMVLDGVVGLRAVKTKLNIDGFSRIEDAAGVVTNPAVSAESEYTDYLPNVSARLGITDKLQMRLAYTQTRTRPSFFDLRPNTSLGRPVDPTTFPDGDPCKNPANANTPECVERLRRGGSAGNPDLRPLTSDNYDVSLEYYFSRTGSFTAALFRHDAQGFVQGAPDRSVDGLRIDRPYNLGDTRLQGAEVTFTSFLDIDGLPEWAKGFGIQANGTYIDAKGDLLPSQAATFNNEQQPFRGVSKWAYNLVALYEKPQFSARLAYNYRSEFVTFDPAYTFQPNDPIAHPVIEKGRGQLDFSTSVTPVPNVTLAFDIANVLGNPLQRYRAYDNGDTYTRQVLYIERSYSLGVRFRF